AGNLDRSRRPAQPRPPVRHPPTARPLCSPGHGCCSCHPARSDNPDHEQMRLLIFEVADLRLAPVPDRIPGLTRAVLVTALPGAPAVIAGVVNARGRITPVYDLRARFGLAPAALDRSHRLVLTDVDTSQGGPPTVALRCD